MARGATKVKAPTAGYLTAALARRENTTIERTDFYLFTLNNLILRVTASNGSCNSD